MNSCQDFISMWMLLKIHQFSRFCGLSIFSWRKNHFLIDKKNLALKKNHEIHGTEKKSAFPFYTTIVLTLTRYNVRTELLQLNWKEETKVPGAAWWALFTRELFMQFAVYPRTRMAIKLEPSSLWYICITFPQPSNVICSFLHPFAPFSTHPSSFYQFTCAFTHA